ncbi:MAG TPA: formate dehydrogenase accessory sulfurtransferase FdhD [Candidatus Baltobacteraceae bacterium]|nr:formate dehydrogenase accessory sulfurtransferase FdhD [Candidatus Baltobacteraceae bacterium]
MTRPGLTQHTRISAYRDGNVRDTTDDLAVEEPLEIRVVAGGQMQRAGVTMRTPGNDFELAAGFLYGEGVIESRDDIAGISYCIDPAVDAQQQYNIVNVTLARSALPEMERLERHFSAGSACGVCGKASIEALQVRAKPLTDGVRAPLERLVQLPDKMREAQRTFSVTGGMHAAALFDASGALSVLREDVGRHNALDKIAGWALLEGHMPLESSIAVVSGRASYELVQKCIAARIPVLCAVSAPSSLAVQLAQAFDLTLLGFVRDGRANVYAAPGRVTDPV